MKQMFNKVKAVKGICCDYFDGHETKQNKKNTSLEITFIKNIPFKYSASS